MALLFHYGGDLVVPAAPAGRRRAVLGDVGAVQALTPYIFIAVNLLVGLIAIETLWLAAVGGLFPMTTAAGRADTSGEDTGVIAPGSLGLWQRTPGAAGV